MGQLGLTPRGEISRSLWLKMTVWNGSEVQALAPPVFQALKSVITSEASRECFPADPAGITGSGRALGSTGTGGREGLRQPSSGRSGQRRGGRKGAASSCSGSELLQHHPTAPWLSAQQTERNNHVLKRLVLRDTVNFPTDTSPVNVYKFPWITCRSENYRLGVPG